MSDLIDTTEMYLRTVFELEEEGVVPLRARIAERLEQSGPTVSQTVARMERDGLLTVEGDRHLELTASGREIAERVMRRHRLAECMLVEVLKVPLTEVHEEACRWEHVMSENVERRIFDLLGGPTHSPFGNPIPGLAQGDDLGGKELVTLDQVGLSLSADTTVRVTVRRLAEPIQHDVSTMSRLSACGVLPGETIKISRAAQGLLCGSGGEYVELSFAQSAHIFVSEI